MPDKKTIVAMFVFSLSLISISLTWIVLHLTGYVDFLLQEITFIIILIVGCLVFLMALFSLRQIQTDVKFETTEINDKEKTVREMYQYNRLTDPPDMNN
jgi:apolipoprotein N-acyltransferase